MFNYFKMMGLLVLLSCVQSTPLISWDCCNPCECNRMYIGGFGGGIYSDSTHASQLGSVFILESVGGAQAINANGNLKKTSTGFGGVQIGYEWAEFSGYCDSDWSLSPGLELEAFFFNHKRKGTFFNPNVRPFLSETVFYNTFQTKSRVVMANAILALNSPCLCGFSPYIGGGIGAARIGIDHAKSFQLAPDEPGINHFNSRKSDSTWVFAGQFKAGLRYNVCDWLELFGEYRYLYLDSGNYIFGSTDYPNIHAPSSPWNVKIDNTHYNAFAFGIQFNL